MSLLRHAKSYLKNQEKYGHLNAFISILKPAVSGSIACERAIAKPDPKLLDMPIAMKDNICTADLNTTAASGILRDFKSPYDATVVELLRDAGAVVVGKTNMDEFGMGSHSTHSIFGPVKSQEAGGVEISAGGSSGGSALAVATRQAWA